MTSDLSLESLTARDRPPQELAALFAGGWPAFIQADELAAQHLPAVRAYFSDLELVLLQGGALVAAGWGVPLAWDGTVAGLPHGYSDALARAVTGHDHGVVANTLVICAVQVRPDAVRAGLAVALLRGLIAAAAAAGLEHAVAPLRPTAKHRYPLTPIEDYAAWTRADGQAFDPWLRTHQRMGARVVGTGAASQVFTGTVQQWQDWSGLALRGDGAYVIPDALSPLIVDQTKDRGTCVEPAIWVQHRGPGRAGRSQAP